MNYTKENILLIELTQKNLANKMYEKIAPLSVTAYRTKEPVGFKERTEGERLSLKKGDGWGELFDCAWFNFSGEIPVISGKKVLLIDISGELCIVDDNGNPMQGLTNKSSNFDYNLGKPGKYVYEIKKTEGNVDIWADAGLNDLFGDLKDEGKIIDADIAICRDDIKELFYDFEVLYDLTAQLPEDSARRYSILEALTNASAMLLDYTEQETKKAKELLIPELEKKNGDVSFSVTAVGNSHVDLAWLWPIRETVRKGARTFSTMLHNMEKYPDYVFTASQPQLFAWMKESYPSLYERLKEKVKEGRLELEGCMWVEADTNVTGGEALVRQILYGKRFFREEFGVDVKTLWLPDVFGYSGALPQIISKSGVPYFMTQKLTSYNFYNKFPYTTFLWKGIDGTAVLSHMPPEDNYASPALPKSFAKVERQFNEKGRLNEALVLYGIGDGGGGPGEEHLERLKREKNLNGIPPVKQEPALRFFERQEAFRDKLNVWTGELYLEAHQGTYTTQGVTKKYNRLMESSLRELELHGAMQAVFGGGWNYPKAELDSIWKEVMLYQFHDILPGSSIKRVYDESHERYRLMHGQVEALNSAALSSLEDKTDGRSVINNLSWPREGWLQNNGKWVYVSTPSMGISNDITTPEIPAVFAESDKLENDFLVVKFAENGSVSSVWDKENGREVLSGSGNALMMYHDSGDAWDFHKYYTLLKPEQLVCEASKAYVDGPCAVLEQVYRYNESKISQRTILTAGSRRLDFETEADWNETGRMLRADFDLNIFVVNATCDIQFGAIERPVCKNNSWDTAKFEICAQKWVDLSQSDYGAALMSDCKYGYSADESHISLNLLRSPVYPDIAADKGHHSFTYSLFPHSGNYIKGGVVRAGYELSEPLKIYEMGLKPCEFMVISSEAVILEAVKKAEDDDSIIIRMYECHGGCATTDVRLGFDIDAVYIVDMMEENPVSVPSEGNVIKLEFKPFEIKTVKIVLG